MASTSGEVVEAVRHAVDLLAGLDPRGLDGRAAAAEVLELHALTDRLTALTALRLPVVEADGWWAGEGARSVASWLSAGARMSYPGAAKLVRLGRALAGDLPATAVAAVSGEVPLDHAHAMAQHATSSPERREALADAESDCGEDFLVGHATQLSAEQFARLVRRWSAAADPGADERGYRKANDRQFLTLADTTSGTFVRGFLTFENSAVLRAALEAVMTPPAPDDARTTPQRRAQGLADLARMTLEHGLVGSGAAVRPQISCVIDYESLLRAVGRAQAPSAGQFPAWTWPGERSTVARTSAGGLPGDGTSGEPPGRGPARHEPPGRSEPDQRPSDGCREDGPPGHGPTDDGPPGHGPPDDGPGTGWPADACSGDELRDREAPRGGVSGDAPARMSGRAADGLGDGGERQRVRLRPVADIERFGVAEIVGTGPVPDHVLARLACDSEITRVIFGPQSQVINAGRAERTFSGPRRRAIVARDITCRYPGCSAPPALGEIHHVDHWARDHGDTDTNRGILLCWHHHALVHRSGIEISPTPSGGWRFTKRTGTPVADAA